MAKRSPSEPDRLPPHSVEAERGVLGCVLYSPEAALGALNECEEAAVAGEWFYDLRHRLVYTAMRELHQAGKGVDVLTVQQWLADRQELEQAGGLEGLAALADAVTSPANLGQYLEILHEKWWLRELARAAVDISSNVASIEQGEKTDASALLARVERQVQRLREQGLEPTEHRLKEVILRVMGDLEDYHRGKAQMRGSLNTGFEYLDKLLCGYGGKNGNYIVISARPNVGKTSFVIELAEYAALDFVWFDPVLGPDGEPVLEVAEGKEKFKLERKRGVPVSIFSLEMNEEALVQRMLFSRAQADVQRWRTGFATQEDLPRLTRAAAQLQCPDNIFISDEGRTTIEIIKAKARRQARQYGVKLFIIDYIQLLRSGSRQWRNDRVQELAEISGEIFALSKELNVPFLVCAQMNRDYEKDASRPPRLSDLKDCGSIEQDADVVGFLHKPKLTAEKQLQFNESVSARQPGAADWSRRIQRINFRVEKNRYGPKGPAELVFDGSCTRFYDYGVWLKESGQRTPAKGERYEERQGDFTEENEERGEEDER